MKKTIGIFLLLLSFASFAQAGEGGNNPESAAPEAAQAASASSAVKRMVICSGVDAREPVDDLTQVQPTMNLIYCWTQVELAATPTTIKHVWYVDGKNSGEVVLKVNGAPWRTWSNKSVWAGKWKVEVQTETGEVLATKEFEVAKTAAPAAPQ